MLEYRFKMITALISLAFIVYVVTFRSDVWLVWFTGTGGSAWEKEGATIFRFEERLGKQIELDFSNMRYKTNLFILISPGGHCVVCLPLAESWFQEFEKSSGDQLGLFIVGDGRQTSRLAMEVYEETYNPAGTILLDAEGALRKTYRLPSGPLVAAFTKRGNLLFVLPLTQAYQDDIFAPFLAHRFIEASIEQNR